MRGKGLRGQAVMLGAMVVTAVAWPIVTRAIGWPDVRISTIWLPQFLDWFALGMGLAVLRAWHDLHGRARLLDQVGDAAWTCWGMAFLLLWLAATPLSGSRGLEQQTTGQLLTKHLLYAASATFLLLPAVFGSESRTPLRAFLESRPMRWLGEVSYGVFLWHLLVLREYYELSGRVTFDGHVLQAIAWVVPVSLLIAWLSFRLVERPALSLKRRWETSGR